MKLTGVFVLVACVLAGCGQVPVTASTDASTTASATSPPAPSPTPTPPPPSPPPPSPPPPSPPPPSPPPPSPPPPSPPPPSPPPPSPPPTSGTATLSWLAPTTDTDGAPLTDLAGYRIYYGTSAGALSDTIPLTSVGLQTYVIPNLSPGTWYFAVKAVASTGVESALSVIVSKTI